MCTQAQLNVVSQLMVACYRKVYGIDRIKSIILYGSYARGDYDSESDIDITAVVSGNREELQEKLKLVWDESAEIGLENDVVVSPTVIPEDEYEQYRNVLPYYRNISMEGRKIG
ncbi:MAG: nucleotidyltransferase domain-containing protein [Clostridiales bacterium]|nr:nucleotidyltransferase domain-containing protein [Clostridiales bacterium]